MNNVIDISVLLTIIGALTVVTNIIVEVLKKITYSFIPTQFLAVGISEALTIVVYVAYCNYNNLKILWYYNVAAVVVGFMVSYAAMFGFDTLKEAINKAVKK